MIPYLGIFIGEWASNGKKRWFVCTECHNPHDVQQGKRNSGFSQLAPEQAPKLPKGLKNADHERHYNTKVTVAMVMTNRKKQAIDRLSGFDESTKLDRLTGIPI